MTRQKRILILGGSFSQISAIKYAKKAGYYVITCGYKPMNPGHKYADEYYNISIVELEAVLALAKKIKVDGVLGFASDYGAVTAAYVCENLGLPTNPYKSTLILTEKNKFRSFLRKCKFNTPYFKEFSSYESLMDQINEFNLPIIVKPIDSSGSRGIQKVYELSKLKEAFSYALSFSLKKRVIVEEFIIFNNQIHGDAFVINNELVFCYLGDHYYTLNSSSFIPTVTTLPSAIESSIMKRIEKGLQELIELLNIKQGALNIEVGIDKNDKLYFVEIAPRNGSHWVPLLEKYASGFDIVASAVEVAIGNYNISVEYKKQGFYAYYKVISETEGNFYDIKIDKFLKSKIIEQETLKRKNEPIENTDLVGLFLFEFDGIKSMMEAMLDINKNIELIIS